MPNSLTAPASVRPVRASPQLSRDQCRFMRELRRNPAPLPDVANRAGVAREQLSAWMRSRNFTFHLKRFARELSLAERLGRKVGSALAGLMIQRIARGELKEIDEVQFRAFHVLSGIDMRPRESNGRFRRSARRGGAPDPNIPTHNPIHPSVSPQRAMELLAIMQGRRAEISRSRIRDGETSRSKTQDTNKPQNSSLKRPGARI